MVRVVLDVLDKGWEELVGGWSGCFGLEKFQAIGFEYGEGDAVIEV